MPRINEQAIISGVVLDHPETTEVFEAHGIDYCCGGGATIAAACARSGKLEPKRLLRELDLAILAAAERGAPGSTDPREVPTDALIARIVVVHHAYVRTVAPELRRLSAKVARVHGAHNPKLPALASGVEVLLDTLIRHLDQEERVVFPALLGEAGDGRAEIIDRELASMYADHTEVGAALEQIRGLADDYAIPEWACPTYRALFAKLRELETDIHRHVHLENNVLMPRFAPQAAGRRS